MTRGRKSVSTHLEELRVALRVLHDPIALEESPLASMRIVQARAGREFAHRTCALGLALSATLRALLREIAKELPESRVARIASGLEAGRNQVQIAEELGISPEQLTRRWKPVLLRLLHSKLQMANEEVKELLPIGRQFTA